jgi:muramidase (phage lysozyme)
MSAIREQLQAALQDGNARAFLRLLRWCEGTGQDDRAYRMFFGGHLFESLADHPRRPHTFTMMGRPITSTAAGAYQFLARTWDECVRALQLPDFGPRSQDMAALFLIRRRGALEDVLAGRLVAAITRCAREWASLPGSPYGQPVKTMAECLRVYQQHGGVLDGPARPRVPASAAPPEAQPVERSPEPAIASAPAASEVPHPDLEASMPLHAFTKAALPAIIESIPKLGRLFGSGSEVAERNVRAAELAVEIVKAATGAPNAQAAAEAVQADPAMARAAMQAVEARWLELAEAGGGGIEGARNADVAYRASGDTLWKSPSFVVAIGLLPLVYMVLVSVLFGVGPDWPSDVRAAIATAIVSLIVGGLMGYYFGQTTSRNRTPAER